MIEFGPFRYDEESRLLYRDEEEIILSPRLVAVLESLLKRPGKIVPREEVLASAWRGAFIGENSLTRAVSELRQTLGDDPQQPTYIQTVPRRGYRFIAEVSEPLRPGASAVSAGQRPAPESPRAVDEVEDAPASPLSAGTRLGAYELSDRIGAGAMGEVWRARDAELARDVAIKIVPREHAGDTSVIERFEREARMLAAVNHPRIATIHGVERAAGHRFIVMELLDGETLQDRLERGPVSMDAALDILKQIAEALEAAHARGIIHRDLKPANIVIDPSGRVKVLDFGLATVSRAEGTDRAVDATVEVSSTAGIGTAPYMSPEQARGGPIDRRTDIWAFGCLAYEVVTGRRAFDRDTVADTLAAVIEEEPAWDRLPIEAPASLRRMLRRCLAKDPAQRLHDVADARIEIEDALASDDLDAPGLPAPGLPAPTRARRWARLLPWGVAAVALALAAYLAWLGPGSGAQSVRRLTMPVPPDRVLSTRNAASLALSPDGATLAFVALGADGISRLYWRPVDGFEAEEVDGSEGAMIPFFSPDGRWLGFVGDGHIIYRVSLGDGKPIKVGAAPGAVFGIAWAPDDTIYFGAPQGLMMISAEGGSPPRRLIDAPRQNEARTGAWPQPLPDGRRLLFSVQVAGDWETVLLDLDTGDRRTVMRNAGTGQVAYVDGYLVYPRSGQLLAEPFDLTAGTSTGSGGALVTDVYTRSMGSGDSAYYSISAAGDLMYASATTERVRSRLVWVEPDGSERELAETEGRLSFPHISPDGRRIAVARRLDDGTGTIPIYEDDRPTSSLRTGQRSSSFPVWTPDGEWIAFWTPFPSPTTLYRQRVNGGEPEVLLLHTGSVLFPGSFTPDGKTLIFYQSSPSGFDIWTVGTNGDPAPEPLINEPYIEGASRLSPDGHWLAYIANDRDRFDVYVEPYPPSGSRWRVSPDGGAEPVWSPDGSTLYYRRGYRMFAVDVQTTPTFRPGEPRLLFSRPFDTTAGYLQNYDAGDDGRLLMIRSDRPQTQLKLILDWTTQFASGLSRR